MLFDGGAGGESAENRGGGAERDLMARLSGATGLDRLLEVWEKISRLLARAESANLDRKQVVIDLFLSLEKSVRA